MDVHRAKALHDLGLSWKEIAATFGICRKTLYNHMNAAGISRAKPQYTQISDDDLDELVAEISLSHPFVGSIIIRGHLKARGFNLPDWRIQESLRRVDCIGVLVRYVFSQAQ